MASRNLFGHLGVSSLWGVLTFVTRVLAINGCILLFFKGRIHLHC